MAAEGMPFPWRLNRSTISANLELISEMSVEAEFPERRIRTIVPFMPFRYLLSGDVSMRSFMPGIAFAAWRALERALRPWMKHLAMFAIIVLDRSR